MLNMVIQICLKAVLVVKTGVHKDAFFVTETYSIVTSGKLLDLITPRYRQNINIIFRVAKHLLPAVLQLAI